MSDTRKLGAGDADAVSDALLAAPLAEQHAQRVEIEKRLDTSKPRGRFSGFLPFVAALFGIKS